MTQYHASGVLTSAYEVAQRLNADENFNADMQEIVAVEAKRKVSTIVMMGDLQSLFSAEDMAAWPYPGTKLDKEHPKTGVIYKGNNPDLYERATPGEDKKKVSGSFYGDVADSLKAGRDDMTELERIDLAIAGDGRADAKLKALGKASLRSLKATINQRRNVRKSTLMKAARLFFQTQELVEKVGEAVGFRYMTDKDGAVLAGPKPIIVFDRIKEGVALEVSVNTFMLLDFDKALENGGDFEAVMATTERGTSDDEESDAEDDENIVVNGIETLDSAIAAVVAYLEDTDNHIKVVRYIEKAIKAGNSKDVKDLLLSVGDLKSECERILSKFEKDYERFATIPDAA